MKALVVSEHGSPEVLILRDVPVPTPGTGQVLIQNAFVGVNFVDTQHRAGLYYPVALPLIPGTEAAGTVVACGPDVTDFAVGDRVAYAGYMGGNYAEFTAVPQDWVVPVPAALPLEQAAASLLQGQAAYVLTRLVYPVKAGDSVLVHAAAGGVGALLVQMAKQAGAIVIGITSTTEKADAVRAAGADGVIVAAERDFEAATLDLTGGAGVHVVYDGVGGPQFDKNLNVLRACGHLVLFGQAGGQPLPLDISRLSGITGGKNRGSLVVTWASANDYVTTAAQRRACAAAIFGMILAGPLRPHISEVFPLAQAAEAHRLLESRTTRGKLLLRVD